MFLVLLPLSLHELPWPPCHPPPPYPLPPAPACPHLPTPLGGSLKNFHYHYLHSDDCFAAAVAALSGPAQLSLAAPKLNADRNYLPGILQTFLSSLGMLPESTTCCLRMSMLHVLCLA